MSGTNKPTKHKFHQKNQCATNLNNTACNVFMENSAATYSLTKGIIYAYLFGEEHNLYEENNFTILVEEEL